VPVHHDPSITELRIGLAGEPLSEAQRLHIVQFLVGPFIGLTGRQRPEGRRVRVILRRDADSAEARGRDDLQHLHHARSARAPDMRDVDRNSCDGRRANDGEEIRNRAVVRPVPIRQCRHDVCPVSCGDLERLADLRPGNIKGRAQSQTQSDGPGLQPAFKFAEHRCEIFFPGGFLRSLDHPFAPKPLAHLRIVYADSVVDRHSSYVPPVPLVDVARADEERQRCRHPVQYLKCGVLHVGVGVDKPGSDDEPRRVNNLASL
jgi:hypothetical protein